VALLRRVAQEDRIQSDEVPTQPGAAAAKTAGVELCPALKVSVGAAAREVSTFAREDTRRVLD
jgi:hypothetical protein